MRADDHRDAPATDLSRPCCAASRRSTCSTCATWGPAHRCRYRWCMKAACGAGVLPHRAATAPALPRAYRLRAHGPDPVAADRVEGAGACDRRARRAALDTGQAAGSHGRRRGLHGGPAPGRGQPAVADRRGRRGDRSQRRLPACWPVPFRQRRAGPANWLAAQQGGQETYCTDHRQPTGRLPRTWPMWPAACWRCPFRSCMTVI